MARRQSNILGKQFGRLLVVAPAGVIGDNPHKQAVWITRCACDTESIVRGDSLRRGMTKSCGCYQREVRARNLSTRSGIR